METGATNAPAAASKMIKIFIKNLAKLIFPPYKNLESDYNNLVEKYDQLNYSRFPPGHYYSPVFTQQEYDENADFIYSEQRKNILGLELNLTNQRELLEKFKKYVVDFNYPVHQKEGSGYYQDNGWFDYSDGFCLYSMIREFKPKNIIEVGSGFSSALMIEVNQEYFSNNIALTFVEPNPEDRLTGLLNDQDSSKYQIFDKKVQDVDSLIFSELAENDILFIDSSHVAKPGSDLNYLLFEVLPTLKKGVVIHFHDVFYPFEYPETWTSGSWNRGFGWNEIYLLRAFLMYNANFEIVLFPSQIISHSDNTLKEALPILYKENRSGNNCQSLWLRKIK